MNWERTIFGITFFIETGQQWDGPCELVWSLQIGAGQLRVQIEWVAK